jgi:putative transposase
MELTTSCHFITPPLTRRKQEAITDLLNQFAASVNLCIKTCLERNLTSRASLHHAAYTEWKSRFNLATHWFHSSGQVATQTLRSWRRLCRLGRADPKHPPIYGAHTMRLELWGNGNSAGICRFTGNAIQIRIRRGEYLWLPLIVPEHHELLYLKDWREGKLRIGEATISTFGDRANVFVPFKREVEARPVEGVCGIDVNELSIDLCILKPNLQPRHIKVDTSGLASIAHSMELKQKSIQEKLDVPPWRPVQRRRLEAKYAGRRRNRTSQVLHVVSKEIASILSVERVEPVFEDLSGIRESMRSKRMTENGKALGRDMRRRLNQWPFRKLQTYVEYKTLARGYGAHYLPHDEVRGTSSTCPMCGAWSKPNGHVFSCKACGYTCDRHFVGAYNIAVRWWTKDLGSSVPPEWRQMQPRVEAAVPPVKPEAKTQKAPVPQFATVF